MKQDIQNITNNKKEAYKKYSPKKRTALSLFIKGNVIMFLLGSIAWLYYSNKRTYEIEMGGYTGPYVDDRSYVEAVRDAFTPFYKGKFDPHMAWLFNVCFQIILASVCLGIATTQKSKYKRNIDIMLDIEKLAKEHKLDPTMAKKMVSVAPSIIKHMSKDSRVYFDMIMEGKISIDDAKFMDIATAIMVGHLQSHPEDMEVVLSIFDEKSIPKEILAIQAQRTNR